MRNPLDQGFAPTIQPELVDEATAAMMLDEAPETRRARRREDQRRLEQGEPIQGPPWIHDGPKRIKYRPSDLKAYAARLASVVDQYARGNVDAV